MLTPRLFTQNVFDDWFDDYGFEHELDHLNKKLYGKHANREMLTDVKEHEDHYDLEIDLPGFKKDDITVDLKEGYLTITASRGHTQDEKDKDGKVIRQERYSGTLTRSFYVGDEMKAEEIRGRYEDGVLTLAIPRKEEKKAIENSSRIMIEG